ncbi:MAG: metallophosphoesterase [Bacteroidota bacterium]|jgi:predicted MPP superfamily phosphohydrolase|uniref:metallophosphoesterase n=1 Tax=Candidatus Pollutiaquabacter sp. TaxID=3416354 RepID=UPI001A59744B|nr:metallophosphoesterase [Bacteroidota bacterium]MBL7950041.1 metallophosphoesterase [Bacteroidia bacterium]HPD53881.1 metallophosphoesterase [Bacteroidia bacterium]HRU60901.1 metallophosphoesterase [Bacteroidia bacterium]
MLTRFFILLFILLLVDLYVFQGVRFLVAQRAPSTQRITVLIYWAIALFGYGVMLTGQWIDWHTWPRVFRTYAFAIVVIFYLSKIIFSLFLATDDILRVFRWGASKLFSSGDVTVAGGISRYQFLVRLGFVVGSIPLLSMLYGMTGGAYRYQVKRVRLKLPNLPPGFEGLRAVQISDIHTGSFLDRKPLERAVELIQNESPDIIFFTGDLVNDRHEEAVEHRDALSRLKAPLGVHSILGNHDYGDYFRWKTQAEKADNLEKLKRLHADFGWNLLLNEHTFIERNGDRIGLLGVENWSARANFSRYGDLGKALNGFTPAPVNILLSHDPSHWKAEVVNHPFIDLTLSGHTHGFQFGVEIPGFRWSPVQYVYKEWADLYDAGRQHLYVNRGLGFLGYPGRVGILPEITVFEFSRA